MTGAPWLRPSAWLLASAATRLRRTRTEWADAMIAEAGTCTSGRDRLAWAWGCWIASLRTTASPKQIVYPIALLAGLALMTRYEWAADESAVTITLLGFIALSLGAVRPRQALLSGALVGLVVSSVLAFEALTGIRPAYEERAQTIGQSLCWLILMVPALSAAAAGARIGRRLRPAPP